MLVTSHLVLEISQLFLVPFSNDAGTTTITVKSVSESIKSKRETDEGFMKSSKSDVEILTIFFRCKDDKANVLSLYMTENFLTSSSTFAAMD